MDRIAISPPEERADLFYRAAGKLRPKRSPVIIEKDFWVCWTLYRLFEKIRFHPQLIFKGGTSLSKVYNAIERFSEDVDLSLSRSDLGFSDTRDPEQAGIGKKEINRRIDGLVIACKDSIRDHLLPAVRKDFASVLGDIGWTVELDKIDPQTITFTYPAVDLGRQIEGYVRPVIRLELGARSDDWPAKEGIIKPYAAEIFPEAFTVAASCHVHTLEAERTFWEKATILHKEYHRPKDSNPGDRRSRHYYDLCQLSKMTIGDNALQQLDLLHRVVEHKKVFFRSSWAHYETAIPGSFHLVPSPERLVSLRTDYAQMKDMIFGDYPEWAVIIQGLKGLETRINAL